MAYFKHDPEDGRKYPELQKVYTVNRSHFFVTMNIIHNPYWRKKREENEEESILDFDPLKYDDEEAFKSALLSLKSLRPSPSFFATSTEDTEE